jgi:Fe-S cluster assembly ATP-binding protein
MGQNLLDLDPEDRSRSGVFLAFQYPLEIPGVSNRDFLRVSCNAKRKHEGLEELDPMDFDDVVYEKLELLKMDAEFLDRGVNEGFSGGEKKRNEILQMALLEPKLGILDEIDSGLDIDALRVVSSGVNALSDTNNAMLLVTHYQRLLDYITPDYIHVMANGRILQTGTKELALKLEAEGYDWILEGAAA